jgi:uncharacterized lipoprotein YmbA
MKNVFVLMSALLLSACVGVPRNSTPVAIYDFGLPAARLVADGAWSRLALEVRSPPWYDSLNVDYRLAYDDPLKHREYAGSRWAGAPGILLAQRLRQQLGTVSVSGNTQSVCLLRVELQEFSQVFDSPQRSRGVLQGSVSLSDVKRQLVAEQQMAIEKPAATADAQGGIDALVAASTELGQMMADWLAGLEKAGTLKSCRL